MLDFAKLLQIPQVDALFDIAPDGSHIAFSWNKSGDWQLYELDLASGAFRPITKSAGANFSPKYSPDGSLLAYVVDFNGGENFHLFILDLATGKECDLTPDIEYALQPNLSWSLDGTEIAYLADKSGHFDTYILNIKNGTSRLVFANGHPCWDVLWSPDGQWLVTEVEMHGQDYGLFLIPIDGSQPREISQSGKPLNAKQPSWSPDSMKLVFSSDAQGFYDIATYDIARETVSWLTEGVAEDLFPAYSPNGKNMVFVRSRGIVTWLELRGTNRPFKRIEAGDGIHTHPVFTPDGKWVVFVFDSPSQPPDLWSLDLSSGKCHQLTYSLPAEFAEVNFEEPHEIRYTGMDGVSVPALLSVPRGVKTPVPAVVLIHGGPTYHYQSMWHPLTAHLVSRGWIVLSPNYRGSTGYGRAWQTANLMDIGGVDTRDCAAGAYFLISTGYADPEKIAVTGKSHGGYLTMSCLTQFPDLWAVGSAVVPFLNFFTGHENSRPDLQHWDIENMGDPHENFDLWHERSPYFFLDRVKAPVQFICGENDPRCPPSESESARDRLLDLGREVDFIMYEDEGHGFLKISNIVSSELRRVAFLAKHLERN
jgi:dipeptidyl aminopeptidase/acylaminoacyl peptidase